MLNISIKPSRQFIYFITLLYVITGLIWLYLPFTYPAKGVLAILHSIHFYTAWYHLLSLQTEEAIIGLQYTPSTGWLLRNLKGNEHKAFLQEGSICSRYFVSLRFTLMPSNQTRYVIILPDSLSSTDFRKLRQRLWWGL